VDCIVVARLPACWTRPEECEDSDSDDGAVVGPHPLGRACLAIDVLGLALDGADAEGEGFRDFGSQPGLHAPSPPATVPALTSGAVRMSPLRIGFIGAGANTRDRHIPGFQAIEGVELAAVVNRRPTSTSGSCRFSANSAMGSPSRRKAWVGHPCLSPKSCLRWECRRTRCSPVAVPRV
jgi:hypothetical protein